MAYILNSTLTEKLLPKLVAMTPYEVYLNQIKSAIEPIRFSKLGLDYFPPQLGGLTGQRSVIAEEVVLEMITFEVP
jgi:hypothetical protein